MRHILRPTHTPERDPWTQGADPSYTLLVVDRVLRPWSHWWVGVAEVGFMGSHYLLQLCLPIHLFMSYLHLIHLSLHAKIPPSFGAPGTGPSVLGARALVVITGMRRSLSVDPV